MSSIPAIVCFLHQPLMICLAVCFLISVVAFHVCAIRVGSKSMFVTKTISSLLFVLIGLFVLLSVKEYTTLILLIFLGLVHGSIGDALLACRKLVPEKNSKFIAAGMIAFALGHIYYVIVAFYCLFTAIAELTMPTKILCVALPFVLSAAISYGNQKLAPKLNISYGKFKWGVIIYGYIISLLLFSTFVGSVVAFASSMNWVWLLPILPITLFTFSDFVLSTNYFDKDQKPMTTKQIIQVHVTYFLAQFLFAFACSCPMLTCP